MASKTNVVLRSPCSISGQKGIALIFFVFLLGLVITGLGIKYLSAGSLRIQRNVNSVEILAKAKAAVIGSVVIGQYGGSPGNPGTFPCPEDITTIGFPTEGQADGACSNTTTSIGRFAWRTLNLGDLRDGNNNKLWYALSAGFRAAPINSDSISRLSIDTVQNQAVAILFAPENAIAGQSRPIPTASSSPIASDYLETENGDGDGDFITGPSSATFNDQMLAIKSDDVFPVLEKRVLADFKRYLNAYKAIWGAYPFPAPFGNPTAATYVGSVGLSGGFMPISNTSPTTTWNTTITPIPVIISPAGNVVSAPSCSFRSSNTRIRCDITISTYNSANPPTLSISGVVDNIGLRFYDGLVVTDTNDIRITTQSGAATVATVGRVMFHGLNAAGNGTVTFTGTLANPGTVRIEFRRTPPLSNWVLAATNHYLLSYNAGTGGGNNWHHLIYYKVAQPFLPGGTSTCGMLCLTVNNVDVSPNTIHAGNYALLVSAGRKLSSTDARPSPTYGVSNPAQARPASTLDAYFDSASNLSGGLIFDSTRRPLNTFNDQVEIVGP